MYGENIHVHQQKITHYDDIRRAARSRIVSSHFITEPVVVLSMVLLCQGEVTDNVIICSGQRTYSRVPHVYRAIPMTGRCRIRKRDRLPREEILHALQCAKAGVYHLSIRNLRTPSAILIHDTFRSPAADHRENHYDFCSISARLSRGYRRTKKRK